MTDALLAAGVFALLVALACAVLYGLTVVPFLLAVDLAERRGRSTGWWAGFALGAVLLAVVLALVAWRTGGGPFAVLAALAVAFVPVGVVLTRGDRTGPEAGRHESQL